MDSLGLWLRHTKYKQRNFLPKFCDDDGCVEVMNGIGGFLSKFNLFVSMPTNFSAIGDVVELIVETTKN